MVFFCIQYPCVTWGLGWVVFKFEAHGKASSQNRKEKRKKNKTKQETRAHTNSEVEEQQRDSQKNVTNERGKEDKWGEQAWYKLKQEKEEGKIGNETQMEQKKQLNRGWRRGCRGHNYVERKGILGLLIEVCINTIPVWFLLLVDQHQSLTHIPWFGRFYRLVKLYHLKFNHSFSPDISIIIYPFWCSWKHDEAVYHSKFTFPDPMWWNHF